MTQVTKLPLFSLANVFTFLRVPLGIVGLVLFWQGNTGWGAVIVIFAAWTDFFDGQVARRLNQVSELGAQLDPIADKALMFIVLAYTFTQVTWIQVLMLGAITLLEAAIMILTLWARKQRSTIFAVTMTGKWGMFGRMSAVCWFLVSSIDTGRFYEFAYGLGILGFVVGMTCGIIAFSQYQRQLPSVELS